MPGIFGFYSFGEGRSNWRAARFVYYGLSALQGRGQESVAVGTYNAENKGLEVLKKRGFVEEIAPELETHVKGHIGIGQVSPIQEDSLVRVRRPTRLLLAGDGIPRLAESKVAAFRILAKMLSEAVEKTGDPLKATVDLLSKAGGGYSFIALTEQEEMICGRDRMGVKPLEVGSVGFDLGIVASETAALDVNGASHSGSINPGEVVVFDPLRITRRALNRAGRAHCAFEYVYLARPDSYVNGVAVQGVRERIGEALAQESPAEADTTIGVPETALPIAMAFSNSTRIPVKLGFMRTGRSVRSAIRPSQLERLMGVQLKLNPIESSVEGRSVVLIDDSVVRGNTLKNTVLALKRKGATGVHVRVGSPPIVSHCPYGVEIPPRDELIGRALSNREIAEIVGADSFAYLSVDGLVRATGLARGELCLGCFTGNYPEEIA